MNDETLIRFREFVKKRDDNTAWANHFVEWLVDIIIDLKVKHEGLILPPEIVLSDNDIKSSNNGCLCQECGNRFKVDLNIPNDLWEIIKPKGKSKGASLLCGSCIMDKIEKLGNFDAFEMIKI